MENWKNKDHPLIRTEIKVGSAILDTLLFNQVFFLSLDLNGTSKKREISLSSETLKRLSLSPLNTRTS